MLLNDKEYFIQALKEWAYSGQITDIDCSNYIQDMLSNTIMSAPWIKEEILQFIPSIDNAKKYLIDSYKDYDEHIKMTQKGLEEFFQLSTTDEYDNEINELIDTYKNELSLEKETLDSDHLNHLFYLVSNIYPKSTFSEFASEYVLTAINNDGDNRKKLLSMGIGEAKIFLKKQFIGIKDDDGQNYIWLINNIPDF